MAKMNELDMILCGMGRLFVNKEYDKVIQILEPIKERYKDEKNSYRLFHDLGHAKLMIPGKYSEERLDEAIEDLNKSVERNPKFADSHYLLACSYMKQERITGKKEYGEKAIEHFKKATEIRPELGPNCEESILITKQMSGKWVPAEK
jgi:tetratricopeptide (TPR) repeat protein